jgi:hypothetical protein
MNKQKVVLKCSIPDLFALVGSANKARCVELQSFNLGPQLLTNERDQSTGCI